MAIPQPSRPSVAALPQGAAPVVLSGSDVSPLGAADPVNMPPRPAFVLIHHPGAYEHVLLEGVWTMVPRLDRFDLVPGVAHVEAAQRGRPGMDRTRAAFAELRAQGAIILSADEHPVTDPAHLPPGVAPGRYARMLTVRDARTSLDGQHWHEVWEVHTLTRSGMRATYHREAYARWRLSLVAAGVIEPAPADIVDGVIAAAEIKLARIRGDGMLTPDQRRERTEAAAAELAALQRGLLEGGGQASPLSAPVPLASPAAPVPPPRPTRARAQGQTPELPPASAPGAAEEGT